MRASFATSGFAPAALTFFDALVTELMSFAGSGQQVRDPQRLAGLQIDHQLELRRLLYRAAL